MYKALRRTVNFTLPWDDMPIDLSYIYENEKPAGKHGFLQANGPHFTFEDGTPARFWGTNFNSAANFPSHEYSEIVAQRLAKVGLNIVRFHQLDGDWSTPNLFQFTKGKNLQNTRSLDPQSMDALDYLIYALKKNGIYVYFDMLTYRRWREGDGVANTKNLRDAGRPQSNFDPRMIELQKEFFHQIWNHFNPYTKLAYKDDPVIVMTEICNENSCVAHGKELVEPYRTYLENRYLDWRKEHQMPPVETPVDFIEPNRELLTFLIELQRKFFKEMYDELRSIGVKCCITGSNWSSGGLALSLAEADMPYMDGHTYHYGWSWKPYEKGIKNASFLGDRSHWLDNGLVGRHMLGRPYFISEWDDPWPNEYRAEGPLHLAAVCCLQGWDGTTIHTYRYDCRKNIDMIAAPLTAEALSGVPYRSGIFDCFNDPCRFGLFYHAALMIRRGDLKESKALNVVQIKGPMLSDMVPNLTKEDKRCNFSNMPVLNSISEMTKTVLALPTDKIPENATLLDPEQSLLPADAEEIVSDTGEYIRNLKKRIAIVDSPRTKIASGFLAEAGELQLKGLKIKCHNEYAVIALSSLTDAPITESDNILLTAVGNVDNTDATYNENHTLQYSKGHGPIEAEVIVADLELDTNVGEFRVDAINANGMQVGQTTAEIKDGKLHFSIGGDFASVYYLIQKI